MHAILYKFNVITGYKSPFEMACEKWTKELMILIGGLGSPLHKGKKGTHMAHAQWPKRETREKAGNELPETLKN